MFLKFVLGWILRKCVLLWFGSFHILWRMCQMCLDADDLKTLEMEKNSRWHSLAQLWPHTRSIERRIAIHTKHYPKTYYNVHKCLLIGVENGSFDNSNSFLSRCVYLCRRSVHDSKTKSLYEMYRLTDTLLAASSVALVAPFRDDDLELLRQGKPMTRLIYKVDMQKIGPLTSNPILAELTRCCRMALYYSFLGDFDTSRDLLNEAKQLSMSCGCCYEVAIMFYFIQYDLIAQFERHPTEHILKEIINISLAGHNVFRQLTAIGEQSFEDECFWSQFILTKLALCMVGIGNSLTIINDWRVSADQCKLGEKYLLKLAGNERHFVLRRKMMYHLAQGRLEELLMHFSKARKCVTKALQCAEKGRFSERNDIKAYLNVLPKDNLQVRCELLNICSEDLNSLNSDDMFGPGHRYQPEGQSI